MERTEIKDISKGILNGRRGHYAIFLLIAGIAFAVASFVLIFIPILGQIASMVVGVIYVVVLAMFTINFCNSRENVDFESLVPTFTSIWKYAVINILFIIVTSIAITPIIFILILITTLISYELSVVFLMFSAILIVAISALFTLSLTFMPYIIIENQNASIGDILSVGFRLSFSNAGKIIVMYLSLIPWYLLIMVTFGLGTLYVMPYINTIFYVMYKDLRGESLLTTMDKPLY